MFYLFLFLSLVMAFSVQAETTLRGDFTQGGLIFGITDPRNRITLDSRPVRVSGKGSFIFGFSRDSKINSELVIHRPDGSLGKRALVLKPRKYKIQRIDGLPSNMVTPLKDVLKRIRREGRIIKEVRMYDRDQTFFESGFILPAIGRISGVYGSQRILNGKKRQPHFGIDIAAPTGTKVVAPADGIVVLAERNLYYSGGTIILDHGHGLTSAFLHLKELLVNKGEVLLQSDVLGSIGATGRATGPHLDWRVNWFERRIDPNLLLQKNK